MHKPFVEMWPSQYSSTSTTTLVHCTLSFTFQFKKIWNSLLKYKCFLHINKKCLEILGTSTYQNFFGMEFFSPRVFTTFTILRVAIAKASPNQDDILLPLFHCQLSFPTSHSGLSPAGRTERLPRMPQLHTWSA